MALRCAAGDETGKVFDGVLAMDPNLEKSTCVLTGLFSRVDPRNPDDVVDLLRKAAEGCETVDEWAEIHDHVDQLPWTNSARNCRPWCGNARISRGLSSPFNPTD